MRKTFLSVILCIFLFACGNSVPKGIIKPDKMENVIYDVHVVDGYVSMIYPEDSAKKVASAYYKGIYKKFDTDSAQFTQSLAYYSKKPLVLEAMYKHISAKLNAQKKYMEKRDSIELKKVLKQDSIKLKAKKEKDSIAIAKKLKADSLAKKIKLKKKSTLFKKKVKKKKITPKKQERF
ncbi:hypothetical protein ABIB40_001820 [Pedobacter sp. UYP30]|uniref:DUF4296 domain-containing protein n=1 Tax=Pedobacter sp. UYP30 TaxID=1756400 RepID=UPI00339ACF02